MVSDPKMLKADRWSQLWLGLVCMILIANLQYAWTLFVNPMHQAHNWSIAGIQVAFSIFIATETWLTPLEGWLVDALGPRRGPPAMIGFGAIMVAIAWVIDAYAMSLDALYVGAALSGVGAGAIYATCVGNAVKWFPDRRGLAVGITAGGFGAGAALTVIPIRMLIESAGYSSAFFWFGLGQGAILLLIAPIMRAPMPGEMPQTAPPKVPQAGTSSSPAQMLATPAFWVLYVMFVLVAGSGLMATAQIAPIAKDFGLTSQPLLFGGSALAVALVVDNVMNGTARPFFGWVSDHIGREATMAIAFALGGCAYLLLGWFGHGPWTFVICAGLIFFTWGEIFSLFPATCTDLFGPGFATTNAMLLYTAKGTAAWLVPLANVLKADTGGWQTVFLVAAAMNFLVVLAALFVLGPARRRAAQRRAAVA
ncbi:MAG TPA: oxalate/formate MFS antiporter [Acetobacteraceae bacterium]|jgi:MFS transporter, OFA family, oxalate/formate antiporter|nr:oxalate/formate MFS antiporter [Acetobacteraceae bacterium]